ncbi:MAG: hypothetical protein A3I05_04170 [Deltaproteobacteria bacterium RIFCSPLOWO2_02_FULL_44_10]|nr:MAG: hypothetical protein A3C46_03680 [Deltaproteobacteria bacterium RIFCSPHIGHO2_02_FULL_44_16]OGQ46341.1 MAG: hypothetical protein A3I05_04170 [Deltaproteobacteria bacterium RIFCSPLOWO2_02_FULL_44_10]
MISGGNPTGPVKRASSAVAQYEVDQSAALSSKAPKSMENIRTLFVHHSLHFQRSVLFTPRLHSLGSGCGGDDPDTAYPLGITSANINPLRRGNMGPGSPVIPSAQLENDGNDPAAPRSDLYPVPLPERNKEPRTLYTHIGADALKKMQIAVEHELLLGVEIHQIVGGEMRRLSSDMVRGCSFMVDPQTGKALVAFDEQGNVVTDYSQINQDLKLEQYNVVLVRFTNRDQENPFQLPIPFTGGEVQEGLRVLLGLSNDPRSQQSMACNLGNATSGNKLSGTLYFRLMGPKATPGDYSLGTIDAFGETDEGLGRGRRVYTRPLVFNTEESRGPDNPQYLTRTDLWYAKIVYTRAPHRLQEGDLIHSQKGLSWKHSDVAMQHVIADDKVTSADNPDLVGAEVLQAGDVRIGQTFEWWRTGIDPQTKKPTPQYVYQVEFCIFNGAISALNATCDGPVRPTEFWIQTVGGTNCRPDSVQEGKYVLLKSGGQPVNCESGGNPVQVRMTPNDMAHMEFGLASPNQTGPFGQFPYPENTAFGMNFYVCEAGFCPHDQQ